MTARHATKITPAMISTDRDIAALMHFARGASEGAHPIYGNFIADVPDALVEVHRIYGERTAEESNAAEELVDTATRLRDHVDALLMGDV